MIEARALTKRYGEKTVVSRLTFTVSPGIVTGFLGPNGSGKSTTMRMIAGLDRPTSGSVRVNGRHYPNAVAPMVELGLLLDAGAVQPTRSAFRHLLAMAQTNGIGRRRVAEVLEMVGLTDVARRPAGRMSLGMRQRLGIAAALLGDPATIVLDEPVNGLDPEGVRWIRGFLQELAAAGRTVFVSSHVLSEMALTAQRLIVIGQGRLIADTTVEEFVAGAAPEYVRVRTPGREMLAAALAGSGVEIVAIDSGTLAVRGCGAAWIGEVACRLGIRIHELAVVRLSLEEAFIEATRHSVEFRAAPREPALGGAPR